MDRRKRKKMDRIRQENKEKKERPRKMKDEGTERGTMEQDREET